VSCGPVQQKREKRYTDVAGFFQMEIERLQKQKLKVHKKVSRNGDSEYRENLSPNWSTELSLFAESDINKPAWRNSYQTRKVGDAITYTALDSNLRTRSITIRRNKKGKIDELVVVNQTQNYLYTAFEKLYYYPDSLYRIIKKQKVVLLGNNSYEISGIFNSSQ
jgi:hypothetical protein